MATESLDQTGAASSAPIPSPSRRIIPMRPRDKSHLVLVTALRDALEAVEFAKQRSHPALGHALDILTDGARETYARVRP